MTEERRKAVWDRMAIEHPEFTHAHDPTNNWHLVEEIILGGSLSWAGADARFKLFPGARVMDIGANVGIFSAFCALNGAQVTAYEPDPVTFSVLSKMLADTRLVDRVNAIEAAVWNRTGRCAFRGFVKHLDSFDSHNGTLTAIGGDEREWGHFRPIETVKCVSFDEAIGDLEWDCVKMDVEGAEYGILFDAASSALRRVKFAFIEFHPWVTQGFYEKVIAKVEDFFVVDGVDRDGRLDYAYLTRKT